MSPAQKPLVLIADDDKTTRFALERFLKDEGYGFVHANDGVEALDVIETAKPDLVLLDILMPRLNGIDVIKKLKESLSTASVPVVVISVISHSMDKLVAFEAGAEAFIEKPPHPLHLKLQARSLLRLRMIYQQALFENEKLEGRISTMQTAIRNTVNEVVKTQSSALIALGNIVEFRDTETGRHLERVQMYCMAMFDEMKKKKVFQSYLTSKYRERLYLSSVLHDLGKIAVPDNVLLKGDRLTTDEYEMMKRHTVIGGDSLKKSEEFLKKRYSYLSMARSIAYSHHERFDSKGYPFGVRGDDIPLSARIVALADVYDAITSKRCYKERFPHETARNYIVSEEARHFDPVVVESFLACEKT
ncbi:MAG: response regulator, partial [Deltaproteobacteria bacterium]|nr:response regulator [Deltaproteobacteria bacterium]